MALNIEQFIGRHFKLKHLIYSNIAAKNLYNVFRKLKRFYMNGHINKKL